MKGSDNTSRKLKGIKSLRTGSKVERNNLRNRSVKRKFGTLNQRETFVGETETEDESEKLAEIDPLLAAEDREIKRLEKLLGISKNKKSRLTISKLNKEYSVNEGIGEDFGSFLMELDDLADSIIKEKGKGKEKRKQSLRKTEESREVASNEEEEDFHSGDEDAESEIDEINDGNVSHEFERGTDNDEMASDDEDDAEGNDMNDAEKAEIEKEMSKYTYRPTTGEDIYGRIIDPDAKKVVNQKYIPPALRNKSQPSSSSLGSAMSSNPQKDILLKRKVKGLINKTSEQTKDTIVRELKAQYESSSHNLTNEAIFEYLQEMIEQSSAKLVSLIPLYTSIFSSLYFCIGNDIIYYLLEKLFNKLTHYCQDFIEQIRRKEPTERIHQEEEYAVSHHRPAYNLLLFFLYFYNYRILHHSFIVEIMFSLIRPATAEYPNSFFRIAKEQDPLTREQQRVIEEMQFELLEGIIYHCLEQLRNDDPIAIKQWAAELSKKIKQSSSSSSHDQEEGPDSSDYSRLQFFYECVHEQINRSSKSSKASKKQKLPVLTSIQDTRKWLGSNKRLLGNKMGDIVIRLSISDLLNVETQGRWWRTGASWVGRQQSENSSQPAEASKETFISKSSSEPSRPVGQSSSSASTSSSSIQKAARRLHMNTPVRMSIFEQIMLSRDILDAYERIMRLSISGKNDREIVKVLIECCIAEKAYNAFYKEIIKLFIDYNRQFKLTCQYILWDLMKLIGRERGGGGSGGGGENDDHDHPEEDESGGELSQRQILNLGRLMSDLIEMFVIPLSSIFKILDVSTITTNPSMQLLLMTFFLQLFQSKTLDETTIQTICDRIATTSDYRLVCDNLLLFLEMQFDLKAIKQKFPQETYLQIKERRQLVLRVIKELSVLDYTASDGLTNNNQRSKHGKKGRKGGNDDGDYEMAAEIMRKFY